MEDIAPELLEKIKKDFLDFLGESEIDQLTYIGAEDYAEKVGEALAKAFSQNLSSAVLPDGKMYWNIADRVVRPLLTEDYNLVSNSAAQVQQALNEAAGLGLKAQTAPLNTDRIDGILNKLSDADQYDDVAWVLDEPVKTFSRSVVDDVLQANVNFQGKTGLRPKIIRKAEIKCCEWCSRMEGTYTYPEVPIDVYRRHERCRCVVEYDPGSGKRKDVWTKQWTNTAESDTINARKQVGILQSMPGSEKAIILNKKVNEFFLDPTGKHSSEFFDVGYTENDGELLKADLRRGLALNPAKLSKASTEEVPKYIVDMQLGITKHRTFRTVWWSDNPEGPRIITAHRVGGDKDV